MKKIISIVCVLAMMLSFAAFSASAAGEVTVTLVKNEALTNGNIIAFDIVLTSTEPVTGGLVQLKWGNFLSAGMTDEDFAKVNGSGTINNVAASDMFTCNFSDTNGLTEKMMGTFTMDITNLTADAAFYLSDTTNVKKPDNSKFQKADITTVGFTVAAPAAPAPSVNTVAVVDDSRVTVTTDGTDTDCQIGSGIALTVNTEVAFTKMIWALTIDGVRSFTKDPIVFDVPAAKGDVKFAATFINGSHSNNGFAEDVPAAEISDVDAIFYDGAADYFTNAADAEYKNK